MRVSHSNQGANCLSDIPAGGMLSSVGQVPRYRDDGRFQVVGGAGLPCSRNYGKDGRPSWKSQTRRLGSLSSAPDVRSSWPKVDPSPAGSIFDAAVRSSAKQAPAMAMIAQVTLSGRQAGLGDIRPLCGDKNTVRTLTLLGCPARWRLEAGPSLDGWAS